jgi:hypothetical protein
MGSVDVILTNPVKLWIRGANGISQKDGRRKLVVTRRECGCVFQCLQRLKVLDGCIDLLKRVGRLVLLNAIKDGR